MAAPIRGDARFLRYLVGCFLFGVGALTYDPILRSYFSHELRLNYTQSVVLADVIPSVCSGVLIPRLRGRRHPARLLGADDPPPRLLARSDQPAARLVVDPVHLGPRPDHPGPRA